MLPCPSKWKVVAYDSKRDEIYYSFRSAPRKQSISRFSRTDGSQGVGNDEVVYSGIFYEFLKLCIAVLSFIMLHFCR